MSIFKYFFQFLKNNKYLLLLGFVLTLVFSVLLLPQKDINTYIQSQIKLYTKGQIQFNSQHLGVSPLLTINFTNNKIIYKKLEVDIKKISLKPLWLDSLLLNFGVQLNAYSIFGGDINLTVKKNKSKRHPLSINLNLHKISLDTLPFSSINLGGKISASLKALVDNQSFNTPNIQLQILSHNNLQILNSKIPSPFGPIQIPALNFSQFKTNITTKDEVLHINSLQLGSNKDSLKIKITGTANLKIKKIRRKNSVSIQQYKLAIYIRAQHIPKQLLSLFSLIDSYKIGNVYQFHIKGDNLSSIPEILK